MKERPILFSGPMVRAILDGRKTQTRRIVKSAHADDAAVWRDCGDDWWESGIASGAPGSHGHGEDVRCPYGSPGDRLWLREAWRTGVKLDAVKPAACKPACHPLDVPILYIADVSDRDGHWIDNFGGRWGRYRNARFMPRWASRLTLEVTEVRVHRLQDVTAADAIAEGARRFDDIPDPSPYGQGDRWSMEDAPLNTEHCLGSPQMAFANAWGLINGKRAPWDSNPWVWAITFRRVP